MCKMVRFRGVLSPKCPICLVYFASLPAVSSCCCVSFFSTSLSASHLKTECELIRSQCSELISCFVSEAQIIHWASLEKKSKRKMQIQYVKANKSLSMKVLYLFANVDLLLLLPIHIIPSLYIKQGEEGGRAIYFQSQHLNTLPA